MFNLTAGLSVSRGNGKKKKKRLISLVKSLNRTPWSMLAGEGSAGVTAVRHQNLTNDLFNREREPQKGNIY